MCCVALLKRGCSVCVNVPGNRGFPIMGGRVGVANKQRHRDPTAFQFKLIFSFISHNWRRVSKKERKMIDLLWLLQVTLTRTRARSQAARLLTLVLHYLPSIQMCTYLLPLLLLLFQLSHSNVFSIDNVCQWFSFALWCAIFYAAK